MEEEEGWEERRRTGRGGGEVGGSGRDGEAGGVGEERDRRGGGMREGVGEEWEEKGEGVGEERDRRGGGGGGGYRGGRGV